MTPNATPWQQIRFLVLFNVLVWPLAYGWAHLQSWAGLLH